MDLHSLILWQDEALVVVNKPAGLLTLPDGYDPTLPHLRSVLEPHLGRLWIVHRLDRDTSGLILLARSRDSHRFLNDLFAQHQVEKTYHAIVYGSPTWESTIIDLPLRGSVGRRRRTAVDYERGKPARTHVKLLESFRAYSLVEAHPQTGRTHQIRAHLTAAGYPLAGDPLYGEERRATEKLISRTALHAWQLSVRHPLSGETSTWQAVYPPDFITALQLLRQPVGLPDEIDPDQPK